MPSAGSVTHWIRQLKAGNHVAAQELWQRYFLRMVGLARKKLLGTSRRAADEEDVALSAFDSFCRGAMNGQFPKLHTTRDLWPLLVVITARKSLDLVQKNLRLKYGSGKVQGESGLQALANSSGAPPGIEQVIGQEPSPEFAAQVAEEFQRLLGKLPDAKHQAIATWKMEGFTNKEIADSLDCSVKTVERKLDLIRKTWQRELPP
jgi:DNA-directed RNA polymerase specialized sigma24 family protein